MNKKRLTLYNLWSSILRINNKTKLKKNELQNLINELALKYNLPPELICSGKSLVKFIRGDSESPLKKGWRSKILNIQQQT